MGLFIAIKMPMGILLYKNPTLNAALPIAMLPKTSESISSSSYTVKNPSEPIPYHPPFMQFNTLRRSNTLEQSLKLQIVEVRLPLARSWKRYSPATVLHLLEKNCRFSLRIFRVCCADDKGCEVEEDEGVFGIDIVLNVVLPCVG